MNTLVTQRLEDHLMALSKTIALLEEDDILYEIALRCISAFQDKKKLLFCGNGGSAADCQHLAAEFVGRFQKERPSMAAIALTANSSNVTAIGNDYGFEEVFARQVEGLGVKGDVLFAFSTSGNSVNVEKAVIVAKEKGMHTIGFLGRDGGSLKKLCDISLVIPDEVTARIQEMHILCGHIICELVEYDL